MAFKFDSDLVIFRTIRKFHLQYVQSMSNIELRDEIYDFSLQLQLSILQIFAVFVIFVILIGSL